MKESPFNIVAGLKAYNFIEEGPRHRRFRVSIALSWGAPFLGGASVVSGPFWARCKDGCEAYEA